MNAPDPTPRAITRVSPRLRVAVALSGLLGLALATGLIVHSGLGAILRVLDLAGWALLWVIPVHFIPIALDAAGWRVLLKAEPRAGFWFLSWVASVRDSINALLPVARVGGEIVGVRLLMARGVTGATAGASVIVEITATLVMQFLFTLIGLAILLYYLRDNGAARAVLIGLLASLPAIIVFFLLQHRWGLFQLLERALVAVTGREVLTLIGDPARLDAAIQNLYRKRKVIAVCGWWQFVGLMAGAAELWFTLYLLGHPVNPLAAILLESLAQAVQSASFIVPAGIGIQEGTFVLFGAATGLTAEVSLALSLARRLRQVGFGIPMLLSWQWMESSRLRGYARALYKK
ncbi:MAG TPA: lysylphosphatidylglycerol synthase domain-containing protein [Gammaproteobacteria bacterium]|nr:lysylphosphatidylglycerol synthase domain-containing protein [Gammaproteobacteria bacterium]